MNTLKLRLAMLLLACGIFQLSIAQHAYFPQEGTIAFDKTVHVKNLLKRHISTLKDDNFSKTYYEELIAKTKETSVLKKTLSFRGNEVLLESVAAEYDPIINNLLRSGLLDYQGTLFQDLGKSISRSTFDVGGSQIYIQDSIMPVKWKITNEYREIAGYSCRRANGVILDSVYVVAFYTDQIPTSGGPGTVHGLPGMILGLVVPEQHYNIYATKVDFSPPTIRSEIAKKKDKPMTRKETQVRLKDVLGRWMTDKQFNLLMAAMFLS